LADDGGDPLQVLGRGSVFDAEAEDHASLVHPAEVPDPALEQVGDGEDELLSGEAAESGGLGTQVDAGTGEVADDDEVAQDERLVEDDREGGEEIAEDVLESERDGDPPDAEAGDQCGHVDPEVLEDDEQHDRPDGDASEEAEG